MHAARLLVLLCAFPLVACTGAVDDAPRANPASLEAGGTGTLGALHSAARANCAAAGLSERTGGFARCVAAYHARAAARAHAEAKAAMERAAGRHGLCVDPVRFELARCIDI